jgi:hypothetical protein
VFLKESRATRGHPRIFLDARPRLKAGSRSQQVGIVLPPFTRAGGRARIVHGLTSMLLRDRSIPFRAQYGSAAGDRLRASGNAMRGGLDFESALEAVTIQPARMLGVEDRVGSVEVGKDADLVLWNGPPFEPSSRVVGVLVDGVLKVDPREQSV